MEAEDVAQQKRSYLWTVIAALCSAITCGITFLFALYRQLALVEVAASIMTGVELYFLSSSIGEWIEKGAHQTRQKCGSR